jgi:hypothetical protein
MIDPYIFELVDFDFQFTGVTLDTRWSYSCKESGCDDEGICRCGTVDYKRVSNVNMTRVIERIIEMTFGTMDKQKKRESRINELLGLPDMEILHYATERICRSHKIWSPEKWNIDVSAGYYGEEVEGVCIVEETARIIIDDIVRICQLQNVEDIVEALMLLEYGSVHQDLLDCTYEDTVVELDKIKFGAIQHLKNVRKKNTEHYSDERYKGIRGVVVPCGDGYRAIDGYHRMNSTKMKTVRVLVAKKIF